MPLSPPHHRGHRWRARQRRGACPPRSRPVRSALCLWLGCYQALLGKDSTRDSSQSDLRARSAPPRREDKQSSLSPMNVPSPPRAAQGLAADGSRTQGPACTACEWGRACRAEREEEDAVLPPFHGAAVGGSWAPDNPHPSPAMPGSCLPNHQMLTHFAPTALTF